jgi:23S rRNA (adenine2030-N6)-methyltransferase
MRAPVSTTSLGRKRAVLRLVRARIPKILRAELNVRPAEPDSDNSARLRGSGVLIVNPPWTFEGELQVLLPALAHVLADGTRGTTRVDWLMGENMRL